MPTVFCAGGFRFFPCSDEGGPREPVCVHVGRGGMKAKFRINPDTSAHPAFSASGLREASRPATGSIATGWPVAAER